MQCLLNVRYVSSGANMRLFLYLSHLLAHLRCRRLLEDSLCSQRTVCFPCATVSVKWHRRHPALNTHDLDQEAQGWHHIECWVATRAATNHFFTITNPSSIRTSLARGHCCRVWSSSPDSTLADHYHLKIWLGGALSLATCFVGMRFHERVSTDITSVSRVFSLGDGGASGRCRRTYLLLYEHRG